MSDLFAQYYKQLNRQQKLAVDSIEGPVMVVAGPGTGKTAILTLRIANILKQTDTAPENILALTFTEAAAANMRRRLAEIIGSAAYQVVISTFHGFCNDLIKNYPDNFPNIIGSRNITEVDQVKILKQLLNENHFKELKPFGDIFYYLKPILSSINELKREGIEPPKFVLIVADELKAFEATADLYHDKGPHKGKMKGDYQLRLKAIKKNQELAKIYSDYQQKLASLKLYDYNDMILEVLKGIEQDNDLLLMLQERSQYLLVDEHQDTNNAQNRIIENLANFHKNPNLFVVGDEKQAIFRFQGASLENFNYFKQLYPSALLINLEENYRSVQPILDSAHSLLAGTQPLKANHTAKTGGVSVYAFSKPDVENYFLATNIQAKLKNGVAPQEIAILYRDNRDAFAVARSLEKFGVPFVVESEQNILDDPDLKKILALLSVIHNFGIEENLAIALHIDFLNFDPLDVYRFIHAANQQRVSLYTLLSNNRELAKLGLTDYERFSKFYQQLRHWKQYADNNSLPELFELVVRESGFLAHVLQNPANVEKLEKLNTLFDEVKELTETDKNTDLSDFFAYLDILHEQNVAVKKRITTRGGRVRLMTAHKSKGQEFEQVYIINAYDGHWGNKRKPKLLTLPLGIYTLTDRGVGLLDSNQDERRLFYVALTRAKHSVTVSYARSSSDGREQLPSQFLAELDQTLLQHSDSASYEKQFAADKTLLFTPSQPSQIDLRSQEFIKELFSQRGLSVTALNNYLECPWKYFYQNLLRIPRPPAKHQMYGIAIHAALKDILTTDQRDKTYLLERFDYYLKKQPLTDRDLPDWLERGNTALVGYYDKYHTTWDHEVLCEFNVGGIMLTPEIRLTGQIDKIELLPKNQVVVVDYKTGKPKSRNVIDGKTKSSDGNIRRQLVFYNLLLNHYADGKKYKMVSGDIDFVEPDERGNYHKERFEITPAEITELEHLIRQTATEILEAAFWDRRCDNHACEFCALRELM